MTFSCSGTMVVTRTVAMVADTRITGIYGRPVTFAQPPYPSLSFSMFRVRSGLDLFYVTPLNRTSSAILCAPGASLEVGQVTFIHNAADSLSAGAP